MATTTVGQYGDGIVDKNFNSSAPGRCGSNFKSLVCKCIIQNSNLGACCGHNEINEKFRYEPKEYWSEYSERVLNGIFNNTIDIAAVE